MLDLCVVFAYAVQMPDETPIHENESPTLIARIMGNPLLRLVTAGMAASLVAFFLILFMHFLVRGFDDSATTALTRYFSFPGFTITRGNNEILPPGARPGDLPELPELEAEDIKQESAAFLEENNMELPAVSEPKKEIEQPFGFPGLDPAPAPLPQEEP